MLNKTFLFNFRDQINKNNEVKPIFKYLFLFRDYIAISPIS